MGSISVRIVIRKKRPFFILIGLSTLNVILHSIVNTYRLLESINDHQSLAIQQLLDLFSIFEQVLKNARILLAS